MLFRQKLPLPATLFLSRSEACVVVVEGENLLAYFKVLHKEIRIPTLRRTMVM